MGYLVVASRASLFKAVYPASRLSWFASACRYLYAFSWCLLEKSALSLLLETVFGGRTTSVTINPFCWPSCPRPLCSAKHAHQHKQVIQKFQLLCPTRRHGTLVYHTLITILQDSYLGRRRGGSWGFLPPSACTLRPRTIRPGHE